MWPYDDAESYASSGRGNSVNCICPDLNTQCSCTGAIQYLPNPDDCINFAHYVALLSNIPGYYQTVNGMMYFHADIIGKSGNGDPIFEPDASGNYTMQLDLDALEDLWDAGDL